MQPERPSARAQRLALVFHGAGTRWALPAAAVLEVAAAPLGAAATTRSGLAVEDIATLFGEPVPLRDARAVTLVLDCAPPRALLVDLVEQVADLATAPFFRLPAGLPRAVEALVRGAVVHAGRLILEADAQALAEFAAPAPRADPPALAPPGAGWELPARALVFEAAGELYGVPLGLVTGVMRADARCPVPLAPRGHAGLVQHEGSLLPIYDLAAVAGRGRTAGALAVALEVGGAAVGLAADRVPGVMDGFHGEPEPGPGGATRLARDGRRIFFPEIERWIPAAEPG